MKAPLLLLLLCSILALSFGEDAAPSSDVISLTSATFADKTSSGDWLVEFFAPWCGHCKHLAPIWEELATASKGKFNVAKVDCTVETEVCSEKGVRGYPTIKFITGGKVHDFNGQRTVEAFTSFVANIKNPAAQEEKVEEKKQAPVQDAGSDVVVLGDATFQEKTKEGDWLVEFFAPWCGHCKHLAPTWEQLATASKGKFHVAKVDCTVETATCGAQGVRGYPTIKFFSGGIASDFNGQRTVEGFTSFVEGAKKPAPQKVEEKVEEKKQAPVQDAGSDVVVLGDATFEESTKSGTWLVEFFAPWCGHCKKLAPTWEELATASKGKFHVAKVDCTVETGTCGGQGVRGYPTVKMFSQGQKFDYQGARTLEEFTKFVEANRGKDEL